MAQESFKVDQDETGCQPPEGPSFCINNCGFFGSAATMNLCSKCYRDLVLKQTRASKAAMADASAMDAAMEIKKEVDSGEPSSSRQRLPDGGSAPAASVALPQEPTQQIPTRCFSCKKRVGLTGFKCKCNNVFCSLHRYSDKHNCSFDYKKAAQDAIAKANPVIKADKLDKI